MSEFVKISENIHIVMLQAYMCYYSDLKQIVDASFVRSS